MACGWPRGGGTPAGRGCRGLHGPAVRAALHVSRRTAAGAVAAQAGPAAAAAQAAGGSATGDCIQPGMAGDTAGAAQAQPGAPAPAGLPQGCRAGPRFLCHQGLGAPAEAFQPAAQVTAAACPVAALLRAIGCCRPCCAQQGPAPQAHGGPACAHAVAQRRDMPCLRADVEC